LGNPKISERGTVIIIPGFNDRSILEMGNLGFLCGEAQKMYEKLKTLEG
jgi:hypothetical protein